MDTGRILGHLLVCLCSGDAALCVKTGVDGGEAACLFVSDGAVVDHVMPQVMSVPGRYHVNGEILDNKVVIT